MLSPLYFDINSVIDRQITTLDSLNPLLTKTLFFGNSSEKSTLKGVDWKEELEIFKEADINSPVLRETFKEVTTPKSGGYSIQFTPIEKNNKGVTRLVVNFNKDNKLESIYCRIISDNWLYSYERIFKLQFFNKDTEVILKSYTIKNSQEILFKKKEESDLEGRIIFPS